MALAAPRKEIRQMDRFFGRGCRAGLALAIGLGSLTMAGASWAAQPPASGEAAETFGLQGPKASKAAKPVRPTPSEKAGLSLGTLPEVRLQAVDTDALLREDSAAERGGRVKALRYGVGRNLRVSVQDGNWYELADGSRLWAGEIVSTGALGLRLHLEDVRLPAGAELAIYAPSASDPARGIVKSGYSLDDPERYVEFFEASAYTKSRFWTGSFFGERVRIEYKAPAGAAADALPFGVDRLQHLYLDPVNRLAKSLVGKDAGSCENDVTCYPEWQDLSHAVSGVGFIGDDSLFCTGQLLNSQSQDFTPYWLTANHCLDNAGDAESVEFFWFYQSAQCNGNPPSLTTVPRSQGATLLSTNPTSDYTLLMVNGALPDGLYWAGWTGKAVPEGTDATAVHHPSGDYKRISFGFKDNNSECYDFRGTDGLQLVRITWLDGVTEPGSSGSGIFRSDTQQLFGQLFFGPSSCGASQADRFDCYGSFVTTYSRIKSFLKGGSDDKSEQNDSCPKAKSLKAGTQANRVVKIVDPDWYKVSVPAHRTVDINLGFSNANGDIDLAAYASCNGDPIVTSTGANDGESVSVTNDGNKTATFYFQVYLSSSTRNTYDVQVSFE
jgi:lysyl endopeptidase